MRIYADINRIPDVGVETASVIIQVAPTPPVGSAPVPVNGKFYVDIPEGVQPPPIGISSKLLGAGSILPPIYNSFLAKFPKYSFIKFNPLLTSADSAALDLAATFPALPGPPPVAWGTRAQVGRGAGLDLGLAPNTVAVLSQNNAVSPARPGVLITDTIDISVDIPAGAREFQVYWKIHQYAVTSDVMDYDGPVNAGQNEAAIKQLFEIDQSPPDFEVYLSSNDGAGYSPVRRMVPCAVCDPGTNIRLAFVNKSPNKIYIASYAIMY